MIDVDYSQVLIVLTALLGGYMMSIGALPLIILKAKTKGLLDAPNERSSHTQPTPRLGGLAFLPPLFLALFLVSFKDPSYLSLFFGLGFIAIGGIKDDRNPLSPKAKLLFQFAGATVVVVPLVYSLGMALGPAVFVFGCMLVFIVLALNSFNLIDGIDGLAGGLSSVSLFGIALLALWNNDFLLASICLTAFGADLGFLKFNWNPASIFMGDTGSQVLGFLIASLVLRMLVVVPASGQIVPVGICIALVALPIFDALRTIFMRLARGRKALGADRSHCHHFISNWDLGHSRTAILLIGIHSLFILYAWALSALGFAPLVIGLSLFLSALILAESMTLMQWIRNRVRKSELKEELEELYTTNHLLNRNTSK